MMMVVVVVVIFWRCRVGFGAERESCNARGCTLPVLHRFLYRNLEFPVEGDKGSLGMLRGGFSGYGTSLDRLYRGERLEKRW